MPTRMVSYPGHSTLGTEVAVCDRIILYGRYGPWVQRDRYKHPQIIPPPFHFPDIIKAILESFYLETREEISPFSQI